MAEGTYELVRFEFRGGVGDGVIHSAMIRLRRPDGEIKEATDCEGVGVIDCAIRSINRIVGEDSSPRLGSFFAWMKAAATNMGSAAPGTCGLTLNDHGDKVKGDSSDPDVVVACVKAYLDGLNRLIKKKQPQRKPAAV